MQLLVHREERRTRREEGVEQAANPRIRAQNDRDGSQVDQKTLIRLTTLNAVAVLYLYCVRLAAGLPLDQAYVLTVTIATGPLSCQLGASMDPCFQDRPSS